MGCRNGTFVLVVLPTLKTQRTEEILVPYNGTFVKGGAPHPKNAYYGGIFVPKEGATPQFTWRK